MPDILKEKQRKAMVARRLAEVRKQKGMNQFELAKAMGCTQGLISKYEAGQANIHLNTLIDICDALGCSLDYLLGREVVYDTSLRGRILKALEVLPGDKQRMIVAMVEIAAGFEVNRVNNTAPKNA